MATTEATRKLLSDAQVVRLVSVERHVDLARHEGRNRPARTTEERKKVLDSIELEDQVDELHRYEASGTANPKSVLMRAESILRNYDRIHGQTVVSERREKR